MFFRGGRAVAGGGGRIREGVWCWGGRGGGQ